MESNGRDRLDSMLDEALAGYSAAEPLAGLEERTLHRVRAMEATRRRLLRWAFAFAAAALVLVAIIMRTPGNPVPKPREIARVEVSPPARPAARIEEPQIARKHLGSRIAVGRTSAPLPKLEQFPAPAPLTAEERALRSFVERDPAAAQQLFAQLRKQINEPIQLEPIQIAPLQTDGAQ